ncbi:MAG: aminopeptidase [Cytophagales bacterium]|nr:aminopeptidase [Bernardetiaceae bacterium]MDW8210131.1 aminopeptidase [Cytophagales bacterium]
MKKLANVFLSLAILLTIGILWQWEWVSYAFMQAKGQLTILWRSRRVEEILQDAHFPDSLKRKLLLIDQIRRFAEDSLALKQTKNYTTFYHQQGKPLLWVLTACPPYELKAYQWHFPFLGSFPYKGFFDLEKARQEEKRLQQQGYDTNIDEVLGWSTLGWFRDPILSNFLERDVGQLAELIIHELTHSTLFVPNQVEYNENLASFVGQQGAIMFLRHRYGENSPEMKRYLTDLADKKRFINFVLKASQSLDSLYGSFTAQMTESEKLTAKQQHIQRIIRAFDTVSFTSKQYQRYFANFVPNNTFFMEFIRYTGQQNYFEEEFHQKFGSNFRRYWAYLRKNYPTL